MNLKNEDKINSKQLDWLNYTKDSFDKYLFSWNYELDKITNKYSIKNIRALCNQCDCPLSFEDKTFPKKNYYCPYCKKKYPNLDLSYNYINDIEKIIVHKIEKDEYKNELPISTSPN